MMDKKIIRIIWGISLILMLFVMVSSAESVYTRGGVGEGKLSVDGNVPIYVPFTNSSYVGFQINPQTMTGAYGDRPPFFKDNGHATFDLSYGSTVIKPTVDRKATLEELVPNGYMFPSEGEWEVPWDGTHYYAYLGNTTNLSMGTLYPPEMGVSGLKPGTYRVHAFKDVDPFNITTDSYDTDFKITYGALSINFYDYNEWLNGNLVPISKITRGSKIHVEGKNTDSQTTYLWLTGKGLPSCGSNIYPKSLPITSSSPTVLNTSTAPLMDGEYLLGLEGFWSFNWDTSDLPIQAGDYTFHAASVNPAEVFTHIPATSTCYSTDTGICAFGNCPGCDASIKVEKTITLVDPEPLSLQIVPNNIERCCCPGYPCGTTDSPIKIKLSGITAVSRLPMQIWLFGNNQIGDYGYLFSDEYSTFLDPDGTIEIDLNEYFFRQRNLKLCDLEPGSYNVVVQIPKVTGVNNETFDVTLETSSYGQKIPNAIFPHDQDPTRIYVVKSDPVYWTKVFVAEGPDALSGYQAYTKLIEALNEVGVRDTYATASFTLMDNACSGGSVDFNGTPTSGYLPLSVQFTDTSTFAGTSWNWDFGDNFTSTEQNPVHVYTTAGLYTVTLQVTNGTTTKEQIKYDYISAGEVPAKYTEPQAAFTYSPRTADPMTLQFIDQSFGATNLTYLWDFGDSTSSTEKVPAHTYGDIAPGEVKSFTVTLTVTDFYGKTSTASKAIEMPAKPSGLPEISFTADQIEGPYPLTVQFLDTTTTTWADSWQWNFGDGATSSLRSPVHVYTTPGKYTVTLRASNVNGEGSEATIPDYISVQHSAPVITATIDPMSGLIPLRVEFTASATVDDKTVDQSAALIESWLWDFGDGSISSEQNPVHVYEKPGSYLVTVMCTLFDGMYSSVELGTIEVGPVPYANFYWEYLDKDENCCYLVKFTDTSYGAASWLWDFGDGMTSEEQNPTHRYKEVGFYNVTLTVDDGTGETDYMTQTVQITSGYTTPTPTPTPTPVPGAIEARFGSSAIGTRSIQFTDQSSGSPIKWLWDFGDDTDSQEQNPTHLYPKDGEYTVTLYAENTKFSDSASKTIGVR